MEGEGEDLKGESLEKEGVKELLYIVSTKYEKRIGSQCHLQLH
jgi:hypothetical protein